MLAPVQIARKEAMVRQHEKLRKENRLPEGVPKEPPTFSPAL